MFNSLSGRFLILTAIFVVIANVLIFLPLMASFRHDYLDSHLQSAQIASLAVLADEDLGPELEAELLANAGVFNVVLRRDAVRQLALSSPIPGPVHASYDLRDLRYYTVIRDTLDTLLDREARIIRVIGEPVKDGGLLIEITLDQEPLRRAMRDYAVTLVLFAASVSGILAILLFIAVRQWMLRPIRNVVRQIQDYARAPEDARLVIAPDARLREVRDAQEALSAMQLQLTAALKQKERLAQLGEGVAKVSHDLRNILTSATLFADRLEASDDPLVVRMGPKLVNSLTRAVHLTQSTLAFGRANEPAPALTTTPLAPLVAEVLDGERLAAGTAEITFVEDIPAGFTIFADGEQIFRVLQNLVRNARQALASSGRAGEITIRATADDSAAYIYVCDTGPGLPPKARENLFRAFQGGVAKGGSGLGLAIAAEIVKSHGGTLSLEGTGTEGSVFIIALPQEGRQVFRG